MRFKIKFSRSMVPYTVLPSKATKILSLTPGRRCRWSLTVRSSS